MNKKLMLVVMLGAVLIVGSTGAVLFLSSRPLNQQAGTYLRNRNGWEYRLFLVDSHLYYGVYEQSFTILHPTELYSVQAGDPCIIINGTLRFDSGHKPWYELGADVLNAQGAGVGPMLNQFEPNPGNIHVSAGEESTIVFEMRIPYNATDIVSYELLIFRPYVTPVPSPLIYFPVR